MDTLISCFAVDSTLPYYGSVADQFATALLSHPTSGFDIIMFAQALPRTYTGVFADIPESAIVPYSHISAPTVYRAEFQIYLRAVFGLSYRLKRDKKGITTIVVIPFFRLTEGHAGTRANI